MPPPTSKRRSSASRTANSAMTKEQWSRTVESITTFITASADLMQNLKDVMENTVPLKIQAEIFSESEEEGEEQGDLDLVVEDCTCTTTRKRVSIKADTVQELYDVEDDAVEEIGDQPDTDEKPDEERPEGLDESKEDAADESARNEEVAEGSAKDEETADGSAKNEEAAEGSAKNEEVADESPIIEEVAEGSAKNEEIIEEPKVEEPPEELPAEPPLEESTDTEDTDTDYKTAPGSDTNIEDKESPTESQIEATQQKLDDGELITLQGSRLGDDEDSAYPPSVVTTEGLLGIASGDEIPTSERQENAKASVSEYMPEVLPREEEKNDEGEGPKIDGEETPQEEPESEAFATQEEPRIEIVEENPDAEKVDEEAEKPENLEEQPEGENLEEAGQVEESPELPTEEKPPPTEAEESQDQKSSSGGSCASSCASKPRTVLRCEDEIANEEQLLHLNRLKQNLRTAQNNLRNIEDQVRELEKLLKDYSTVNPGGKINPAVLYREIMKPQTVPFFRMNNNKMSQLRIPRPSINNNNPQSKTVIFPTCYTSSTATIRKVVPCPRNNERKSTPKENVSVLSTSTSPYSTESFRR